MVAEEAAAEPSSRRLGCLSSVVLRWCEMQSQKKDSPFHEGELKVQKLLGEEELAKRNGQVIKNEILEGALDFIARQSMVVVGSTSGSDDKHWASIVCGTTGFASAPDLKSVVLDLNQIDKVATDPLWQIIEAGRKLGLLFIELETRRRLKVNGTVELCSNEQIRVKVEESYPLCPKYIQRRKLDLLSDTTRSATNVRSGSELVESVQAIIAQADTAFLVTGHTERGLDVSHRGGKKGFLTVTSERRIRCPDYSGNGMFNSFGNLDQNPKAGLTIVDFKNSLALQLTGTAFLEFNQDDPGGETGGTGRYWSFDVESWLLQPLPLSQREFLDYSPFIPS